MSFLLHCVLAVAAVAPPERPSLPSMLARARELIERADRAAARRELTAALARFPREPAVHNFLGVLEAEEGNRNAAEARFLEALRLAPDLVDAHLNLGRLYQENAAADAEAPAKALASYEAVLAAQPAHREAAYQSAMLLTQAGRFREALERLGRLPAPDQERTQALTVRCAALAGAGQGGEAERVADRLLLRPDLDARDVFAIVPALTKAGRDDLSRHLLEGLQSRQPSAEALMELARVAHRQRDPRGALGYLARARELAPQDARVHFFFGMVCVDLDLGVEAYDSLKEAVRLEPDNAIFNYALAAVALHRPDPAEALPYFRKYRELRPDDPRGTFALGFAAFRAGDAAAARVELRKAAERPETAGGAHYVLARIAREEGDVEGALTLIRRAVELAPQNAEAWAEMGLLLLRKRELPEAERALRRCLELDPESHLGNYQLLLLYERRDDPRTEGQRQRFAEIQKRREQKAQEFLRLIEVRPY